MAGEPWPRRHQPTVIVARRALPGRERDLERWLRRLVARAAEAPGYVDAEVQPPNELHPDEWVVVYRFADQRTLARWMESSERSAMMASGADLVDGPAREQVVALAPHSDRVTAVSSVRVKPDEMAAFRALHGEILVALSSSAGFLRADLFEPVEGVQDETVVVLAFDSREHLDQWLASPERAGILGEMERHSDGERTVNVVGGFAGWFTPLGGADVRRWKSAVTVLAAIVPVSLLYTLLRISLFPDLHAAVATVIGNVVGIVVLTWLAMPWLTRRLDGWLRR